MKYKISLLLILICSLLLICGCGDDVTVFVPTPFPIDGTNKLTVNVIPPDAEATVRAEMLSVSSADLTEQAMGEFVIYLAPGTYNVIISAAGYNTITKTVTINEGQDKVETADLTGEEIPIESIGPRIEPKVCVNSGIVSFTLKVNNFIGTGTVELLSGTTVLQTDTPEIVSEGVTCEFTITIL